MTTPRKPVPRKPARRRSAVELRTRDELLAAVAASEARLRDVIAANHANVDARLTDASGRMERVESALLGDLAGKPGILPRLATVERRVRQLVAILVALPAACIAGLEFVRSLFRP